MAATLGVATFHYMPYAIFNFASPLLAMALAFFGLRMLGAPRTPGAAGAPQSVAR
jgi:NhaC family Na+:H+ antiporter